MQSNSMEAGAGYNYFQEKYPEAGGGIIAGQAIKEAHYLELTSAIKPIMELISNGLYSDAVKSIKVNRDKLYPLPEVLKALYDTNRRLIGSMEPQSTPPVVEDGTDSDQKPLATQARAFSPAPPAPGNSAAFEERAHDRDTEEFQTIQLNKMDSALKKVIYFKEYSYPAYFNSFVKYLHCQLSSIAKTRLLILEHCENRLSLKRYGGSFHTDLMSRGSSPPPMEDCERMVFYHLKNSLFEPLLKDGGSYKYMIVYDKSGRDTETINGTNVYRFNLVKKESDAALFKLPAERCISNGFAGAALNLTEILRFREITNETIKQKLFKKHFIDRFLELVHEGEG